MRLLTRGALAVLPLALSLTLTACGDEKKPGVASAPGGGGNAQGAQATAKTNPGEMGLKFAECMRKNGIPMEDPKAGGGGVQLKIDKNTPKGQLEKAQEACRQFNPMEQAGKKPDPKMEENNRKFAECMRKNGVEAFPDPKPGQRGVMISGEVGEDPDFKKADDACKPILRLGGGAGQ